MVINLLVVQFVNSVLLFYLMEFIELYKVDVCNIELEFIEIVLVVDIECVVEVIQQICVLGCKIVVDDFGIGYLLLSYLKMIFSDIIKIDCFFIVGMFEVESDCNIVSFIISMVCSMGQEIIVEGIE